MGHIGVRCAIARCNLWFHLDIQIAEKSLHPEFRTDGADKARNDLLHYRHPWHLLTYVGSRIILRVLAIPGVVELAARRDYFALEVVNEECWRTVLPKVVEIIRNETDDPLAEVVVRANDVAPIPQWHATLLHELFS